MGKRSDMCKFENCIEFAVAFAPYGRYRCAGLCQKHHIVVSPTPETFECQLCKKKIESDIKYPGHMCAICTEKELLTLTGSSTLILQNFFSTRSCNN